MTGKNLAAGANSAVDMSAGPLPAEHRSMLTELLADIGELTSMIGGTEAMTEASVHLHNAKVALTSAAQYLLQHFEVLEAKVTGEVAEIFAVETEGKSDVSVVEAKAKTDVVDVGAAAIANSI